jgi:hypothetical protein
MTKLCYILYHICLTKLKPNQKNKNCTRWDKVWFAQGASACILFLIGFYLNFQHFFFPLLRNCRLIDPIQLPSEYTLYSLPIFIHQKPNKLREYITEFVPRLARNFYEHRFFDASND